MEKIRLGIIGMGNMGSGHLKSIIDGECPNIEVSAVCDIDEEKLKAAQAKAPSAKAFTNADEMINREYIDAALIAVPHYDHPRYVIECLQKDIHVMTEKPAGVYARQVREMNEAAQKSNAKFAIMFNQRTNPIYARAREIIQSGQLGQLKRLVWIVTNWYRSQAYYDSGSWRATWNGEGGGVLLNQAPHNLDLWQWIFGMPKRVRAFCYAGKYHNIGVEDDVTIYGEYENGATSVFISTTGETPGTNRLEISGDLGKLVLEDGKLKWWKLSVPEREFCFTTKEGFAMPQMDYEEFTAQEPDGHPILLNNFADAILEGKELIANGYEGINSLMISNAAYISSWTDDWAEIPSDEKLFEEHLIKLCQNENSKKTGITNAESIENLSERWKVRW